MNDPAAFSTGLQAIRRQLFYGGEWHEPCAGDYAGNLSPADRRDLGRVAVAMPEDLDHAIAAAREGFLAWRDTPPRARAAALRQAASIVRAHGEELALIDAVDCGNPVASMRMDSEIAAEQFEFFAGLVTEMKGASIPMGPGVLNVSVREPMGIIGKIVAFNHPFMFCAGKSAAPLAAGNAVIVKPAEQAPLSALRFAELVADVFPPGVFNLLPGGREIGAALAGHPEIAKIGLIGSVATGRAVLAQAAATIKPALLELGGKNAVIAFPDADPDEVADGIVVGMNFAWCGQSCGSTSRAFLHEAIHDAVVERLVARAADFRPGDPTDPATGMGAITSAAQHSRILDHIRIGQEEGAVLVCGGGPPSDPALAHGYFIEPTIFTDVRPDMRIAQEEIFGPVLSVLKWRDEASMIEEVNSVAYGLTASLWTDDLHIAVRVSRAVEAGYVWVNETAKHFLGAPFGGYKQSGIGREECLEELLSFTQEKNIHIRVRPRGGTARSHKHQQ